MPGAVCLTKAHSLLVRLRSTEPPTYLSSCRGALCGPPSTTLHVACVIYHRKTARQRQRQKGGGLVVQVFVYVSQLELKLGADMSPKGLWLLLVAGQLYLCGAFTASPTCRQAIQAAHSDRAPKTHKSAGLSSLRASWASGYDASRGRGGRFEQGNRRLSSLGLRPSQQRLTKMAASTTTTADTGGRPAAATGPRSVNWPLWYVLPIAPYQRRKTLMKEIVPGKVREANTPAVTRDVNRLSM